MPNPLGANPLNPNPVPYGDVKRTTELTREAPMSGGTVAGRALNTPNRAQDQAVRGTPTAPASQPAAAPVPAGSPPATEQPQTPYYQQVAQVWQALAAIPGASAEVRDYARRAVEDASRGG